MTGDQQFILAILAIVASVVTQGLLYRKAEQTHQLVNGMTKANARRARVATLAHERRRVADKKTAQAMQPRQSQNEPPPSGTGYGST